MITSTALMMISSGELEFTAGEGPKEKERTLAFLDTVTVLKSDVTSRHECSEKRPTQINI